MDVLWYLLFIRSGLIYWFKILLKFDLSNCEIYCYFDYWGGMFYLGC